MSKISDSDSLKPGELFRKLKERRRDSGTTPETSGGEDAVGGATEIHVGGRRYILADDEESLDITGEPNAPEPEIMQYISPVSRHVPLSVWLYLPLKRAGILGWIFACAGLLFICFLAPQIDIRDFRSGWTIAGSASVQDTQKANISINDRMIYKHRYTFNGKPQMCYSYQNLKIGSTYEVYVYRNNMDVSRLEKTYLAPMGCVGWAALFFIMLPFLFFLVGMCIAIYLLRKGWREARLLTYGTLAKGYFTGMSATNVKVNDKPIMKLNFKFRTDVGEEVETSTTALKTDSLIDDPWEVLFYAPEAPTQSVFLENLPSGVQVNASTGGFRVGLWRIPIYMIMPILFLGEILYIIKVIMSW